MFTLREASEAGYADCCQRVMIVGQLGQVVTTLQKVTEPVVAIGKADTSAPAVRVTVQNWSQAEVVDARLKQLSAISHLRLLENHHDRIQPREFASEMIRKIDYFSVR
jgi:hypothetical protein